MNEWLNLCEIQQLAKRYVLFKNLSNYVSYFLLCSWDTSATTRTRTITVERGAPQHETDRVGQMILWMAFLPIYGAIHSPPHQRQCDAIMTKQKTRIAFIARDELSQ